MSTQKRYPPELRERAVRLALESGRPIAQVARDLGVGSESLRHWVRQAQADAGQRAELLSTGASASRCSSARTASCARPTRS